MCSTYLQSIPKTLKQRIKDTLNPYLTGNYTDAVRNPVLLLNFLYQHSVIFKPEYDIQPDPDRLFHFIGSCTVGFFRTEIVKGDSKKDCKNKAAQKILDLFLESEKMDIINDTEHANNNSYDNQTCQINLAIKAMSIDASENSDFKKSVEENYVYEIEQVENTGKFYEDDLTGILSFDDGNLNCALKSNTKTKSLDSSSALKCENPKFVALPECEKVDNTPVTKSTFSKTSMSSTSQNSSATKRYKDMEVAQPQGGEDMLASESMWSRIPVSPSPNCLNSLNNTDSLSQLSTVGKSNQVYEDQKPSHSEKVLFNDNLYVDFFDPFLRLRPRINGFTNISQKENSLNVGKENTNIESVLTCEAQSKFPMELGQNNKTPFQILQEKAVKNFKLIPRSRIDKTDNGFSCTLILDVHSGYGEGRTKKEAKLKAATHLLQLLESL